MLKTLSIHDQQNFSDIDEYGLVADLNPWGWPGKASTQLKWSLDENSARLDVDQRKVVDNSRVVAMPRFIDGTAFGRWEQWRQHEIPKLNYRRGVGGMDSPAFDLREQQKLTGWPYQVRDLPDIVYHCGFEISPELFASVFFDSYAHANKGDDVNRSVNPNESKSLNVNLHLGRPLEDNTDAPGGGWSGGRVIDEMSSLGVDYWVVYKREMVSGNNFDYVSFLPKSGVANVFNMRLLYEWAYSADIRKLAKAVGLEARAFYTDRDWDCGGHLGSEIWHGHGSVLFDYLQIMNSAKPGGRAVRGFGRVPDNMLRPPANDGGVRIDIKPEDVQDIRALIVDDVAAARPIRNGTGVSMTIDVDTLHARGVSKVFVNDGGVDYAMRDNAPAAPAAPARPPAPPAPEPPPARDPNRADGSPSRPPRDRDRDRERPERPERPERRRRGPGRRRLRD